MNKETIIAGGAGIILGILIAPIFMPMMPWGGMMGSRNSMMGDNQMMGEIDSHFIVQMILHHEDAITMANLALTRAEHPEIKALGNSIIKSQSEEINQMKQWYKTWFGSEVVKANSSMGHSIDMMGQGGMVGNEADTKALVNTKSFDKEFIEKMIPHHQMAVMMAQMLLNSTDRPEMKQLAANIISSQTKEINDMREWYRAWYGN